jgi:hypothetical protein
VGRGGGENLFACFGPTGERNEVDVRVSGEGVADPASRPQDEVHDALGNTRLGEQLDHPDRGQRRHLAGLDDDAVAGRKRGSHLPRDLEQRVVPWRDQSAHADWLIDDPAEGVRLGRGNDPAGFLVGEAGVVAEDGGHIIDVEPALPERLARVERLQAGDLLAVAHQEIRRAVEERAALAGWRPGPRAVVERPPCGPDRTLDVDIVGDVDLPNDAPVGRVDDRKRRAGRRADPLSIDEQARHGGALLGRLRRQRRSGSMRPVATSRRSPPGGALGDGQGRRARRLRS